MRILSWSMAIALFGATIVAEAGAAEVWIESSPEQPSSSRVQLATAVFGQVDTVSADEVSAAPPRPIPRDPAYESAPSPFTVEGDGCAACGDECAGCGCGEYCCGEYCGCGSCRGCRNPCLDSWGEPCRWFTSRGLACRGITIGGWIDQGISVVANRPTDRFNGPVTFNDRDGEYQMNQLWFFLEKETDTGGCGWDVGGRVDFVYGADARFTQCSDGLEASWSQTERFYQTALPQFYADVAYNNWTVRMGHFFTIIGYETVPAPQNFFYSHSYTMQYGEPFTHTGMLVTYALSDGLSVSGGLHRGWDQFNDTDGLNRLSFLGGVSWTDYSGRRTLDFAITAGEQGVDNNTVMYSLVGTVKLNDCWTYVIQHDYGQSTGGYTGNLSFGRTAEWYGINQYLFRQLNRQWSAGIRFEWFRDDDGTRVAGLGDGNRNTGPYVGDFYEISLGANWKPHRNVVVRPEVRWDWFEQDRVGIGSANPYDAGQRKDQFLFGCDVIVQF